jgi:hypothetical protein
VTPEVKQLRLGLAEISSELRAGALHRSKPTPSSNSSAHLEALREVLAATPKEAWPRLATAFNEDQIESKLWLVEHMEGVIDPSEHRIVILGAWYGVLALIMNRVMLRPPAEVLCVDIDAAACALAERLLSILSPRPEIRLADMMEIDYTEWSAGREAVFINTSCEHLPDFSGWRRRIPPGARLVLQSNNHEGCPEHVNCVADLAAFERQASLSHTDYRGSLQLRKFQRFMLIGRS